MRQNQAKSAGIVLQQERPENPFETAFCTCDSRAEVSVLSLAKQHDFICEQSGTVFCICTRELHCTFFAGCCKGSLLNQCHNSFLEE